MQNVCLVTTQLFKRGKSGRQTMETFAFALAVRGYICQDLLTLSIGEKLDAKREFNNTMDKPSCESSKGQLPHKFSRIVWYFLARSGEISVEVIGRRRCGRMEVPWQFEFNCSNKVKMKLLKELLVSKSRV